MKKLILTVLLCTTVFMVVFGASTVKVWFAGTQKQLMDLVDSKLIPEFEKNNPDIKIKAEFIPWGELSTKLTTSFAGGIGPDIFMHGQAAIAGFADKGIIMPIDSILSKIEDPQDFGATLNAGLFKGKKYYIPVFGSGRLLAYRKDFFVQAGLDPQDAPITWEQLISYSKKLTSVENNRYKCAGFDLPVSGVDLQQVWSGFLYQNGGELFDNEMNPVFNSTQGVQALQFYVDLIRKEKVAPDYGTSKTGNLHSLASGSAAMGMLVLEEINDIKTYAPHAFEQIELSLSTARLNRASFYSFAGFMVSSKTKDLQSTAKVLSYLTSKNSIVAINEVQSTLPPRQSAAESEFVSSNPVLTMFVKGAKYAFGNPNVPFWVQARDILIKYLERAVKGNMDCKSALDQAAQEIMKLK
ncbi:MAG TPA: ABC transporter substrate-binding protein [Petrotogaceae bacterium]|mgnify:FL=1|nr:ABC transporter substrate-binding protein [Petrotogaceae bacterium]